MSLNESIAAFRVVAIEGGEIWEDELGALQQLGCKSVEPMIALLLTDENEDVRCAVADVLDGWHDDERVVAPLIQALHDRSASVRAMAARRLGNCGHISAIEPLIAALQDENIDVRKNALSSLGQLDIQRSIDAIVETLRSDPMMTEAASTVLSNIGAFQYLREALEGGIQLKPIITAKTMVHTHDKGAFEFLVDLLANGNSSHDRSEAVSLMGTVGDLRMIPYLHTAGQDEDWKVRLFAGKVLMKIGDDEGIKIIVKMLDDQDTAGRALAAIHLGKSGDSRSVEPLLNILHRSIEAQQFYSAAQGYVTLWSDAVHRIVSTVGIVSALGRTADPRVIGPLIYALQCGDASAATALGRFDDPQAIHALIEALHSNKESVRSDAISAVSNFGGSAAVEPLISVLDDSGPITTYSVVQSLGKIGDPRATEAISPALSADDAHLRRMAAWALYRVHSDEAGKALRGLIPRNDIDAISGAYAFFIENGIKGSEDALLAALTCHGHKAVAEDYAGSGNDTLAEAGREWLSNHPRVRYSVQKPWTRPIGVKWGSSTYGSPE